MIVRRGGADNAFGNDGVRQICQALTAPEAPKHLQVLDLSGTRGSSPAIQTGKVDFNGADVLSEPCHPPLLMDMSPRSPDIHLNLATALTETEAICEALIHPDGPKQLTSIGLAGAHHTTLVY